MFAGYVPVKLEILHAELLINFPGVGAFDHLFGPGRGAFEKQFSKNSIARSGRRYVEASISLVHNGHDFLGLKISLRN